MHALTSLVVVPLAITTKFTLSPEQWVTRLARLHNAQLPELELLDAYYEGEQRCPACIRSCCGA
ncbi:hypothetical protein [Lentzea aerocolonigenes]|uniref:hypothetical protein n=1 Tax=Lentzea aerocolonigenes TaxID=68170 RepID=UPI0004C3301A|nr:hypothetical protein [Lentzea aerocolonigenes]